MTNEQLNSMALEAKKCTVSMWKVKAEFWPLLETIYEETWTSVHRIGKIESECEKAIEEAVEQYDPGSGNFGAFVRRKLYRTKQRLYRETSRLKRSISFIDVDSTDIYDDYNGMAAVEVSLDVSEKATRLAAGDPLKEFALKVWRSGRFKNLTDLARQCSVMFGGKTESIRVTLSNFKAECSRELVEYKYAA